MEMHERLKLARQRAGLSTAKDAAQRLGVPYGTYSGHEAGTRGIKRDELERYAKAFGTSVLWLAYGARTEMTYITTPAAMLGKIDNSFGYVIDDVEETSVHSKIYMHPIPIRGTKQGVIHVQSNALSGFAPIGSYIYFEFFRGAELYKDVSKYEGRPCLLEIYIEDDWRSIIGVPYLKRDGTYFIDRFILPTLQNVEIRSVTPIIGILMQEYGDRILEAGSFQDISPAESDDPLGR